MSLFSARLLGIHTYDETGQALRAATFGVLAGKVVAGTKRGFPSELEAIAAPLLLYRFEAIATRLEAIAISLEAIAILQEVSPTAYSLESICWESKMKRLIGQP